MEGHCHFFVTRKKRYCRMSVKKGNEYCGEHLEGTSLQEVDANEGQGRIACPLDPTHTCYRENLKKHLKVCNAKAPEKCPHVVKNYNAEKDPITLVQTPLSQISPSTLNAIIEKVNKTFEKIPAIADEILTHAVLESELKNPLYGSDSRKHLLQIASLLAHLEQSNLLREDTCFIDFGAGKGKLTYWLAQAMKDQKGFSTLLIDRSSLRHKSDNKLKTEKSSVNVKRIRADIADLRLVGLPEFQNNSRKVAIAKHLCGVATDLTLRCLTNAMSDESEPSINGLFIAFCCHHRCDFNSYVGKDYLEKCGFVSEEFSVLCSIASWATCGFSKSSAQQNEVAENATKMEIGRRVKILLNWGRVEFLKKFKFECRLVNYVPSKVSLENTCIVATRGEQ